MDSPPSPLITEHDHFWQDHFIQKTITAKGPTDSITVKLRYKGRHPVDAFICPLYEPPDIPFDGGAGSILLLRALIRHIRQHFPSITHVRFEDQSIVYPEDPLPLRYFWIAFGGRGETWFETHFHAIYQSNEAHDKYRKRVNAFLTEKTPPFHDFLRGLTRPDLFWENQPLFQEVEQLYASATTYNELFDSIPKERRYEHARIWVIYLVEEHVTSVMSRMGWRIDVTSLPEGQPDDSSLPIQRDGGWDRWRAQCMMSVSDVEDE